MQWHVLSVTCSGGCGFPPCLVRWKNRQNTFIHFVHVPKGETILRHKLLVSYFLLFLSSFLLGDARVLHGTAKWDPQLFPSSNFWHLQMRKWWPRHSFHAWDFIFLFRGSTDRKVWLNFHAKHFCSRQVCWLSVVDSFPFFLFFSKELLKSGQARKLLHYGAIPGA